MSKHRVCERVAPTSSCISEFRLFSIIRSSGIELNRDGAELTAGRIRRRPKKLLLTEKKLTTAPLMYELDGSENVIDARVVRRESRRRQTCSAGKKFYIAGERRIDYL